VNGGGRNGISHGHPPAPRVRQVWTAGPNGDLFGRRAGRVITAATDHFDHFAGASPGGRCGYGIRGQWERHSAWGGIAMIVFGAVRQLVA